MALSAYQTKIIHAFKEVSKANHVKEGVRGASAAEVVRYMSRHGMLAELDTVIDIADQLQELSHMGYLDKAVQELVEEEKKMKEKNEQSPGN